MIITFILCLFFFWLACYFVVLCFAIVIVMVAGLRLFNHKGQGALKLILLHVVMTDMDLNTQVKTFISTSSCLTALFLRKRKHS